ncbi:MAG TPA: GNAT family N-acetyltransferase [Flavobacterium sp.]|jgi:ribosomal protein S18 acetylase RimI-like enzyme|uniref:GNAT family N-acetyltransferase n=1 Tax=Flavobacterium sp. TaxID=239 RepID=UPI001B615E25|nr:GNAT family N-acetyltransferase [Flavobacterium sp.]MBP7181703.1 GNAT family N-acetyltransferase [Flavobacterium sp.]MBP7317929.1 GNAT family N-acetyltransferase [Flavobacterium sp.]MBP8886641.1 GNAT family N-acetyltransferase [Flavobacterium sp.]HRL70711.1 GNAT family N-acetyltransferase [Flavobacterium sp.]HRM12380.1 GNAT family N-acetyltransferase [Flavobacterium sp.]
MIQFKPLVVTDIDTIVTMMKAFYAIDNYPIDKEKSKTLFQEFISNEDLGKSWLILSDEETVGYVILTFVFSFEYQGKIAFLDELYLNEKARGKGIGSQAVTFVLEQSKKLSLQLIYLEIENHNQNAQKLYIANGFELHNRKLMTHKLK